jgi:3-hydroxybutyryl-CoA dehydrogenase
MSMSVERPEKVAVLGMGTMGAGIAQVCATAGLEVVVLEATEERWQEGRGRMERFLAEGVRRGKVDAEARDGALSRVVGTVADDDLRGAQLVIEAVVEDLEVKRDVLARAAAAVGEAAIIATNTSAMSVTRLAAGVPVPERFAGLHFFNPAPLMPLVEVVPAVQTSEATTRVLEDFVRRLGKHSVVTMDRPGFLVNRLLMPYLNQAVQDYDDGLAEADDLDAALELGLGYPMGPLKLLDLIGLDNHLHATQAAWEQTRDPHAVPPPLLERLVDAGRLGRKTGHGFRVYE